MSVLLFLYRILITFRTNKTDNMEQQKSHSIELTVNLDNNKNKKTKNFANELKSSHRNVLNALAAFILFIIIRKTVLFLIFIGTTILFSEYLILIRNELLKFIYKIRINSVIILSELIKMVTKKRKSKQMIYMLTALTIISCIETAWAAKHFTVDLDIQPQSNSSYTLSRQQQRTALSISPPTTYMNPLIDVIALPLTSAQQITSSDILSQYALPNDSYFTHMTFDRRNSVIYAGASNRILQLNYNLSVLQQAITGPKADNPQCHGVCPEDTETSETINHNKILIVNEDGGTLIACGSVMQGSCYIYQLKTFPHSPEYVEIPLAANDELASTLAFIGPSKYNSWKREDVLYVGTTFTNVGEYRHDVPAISSRRLDDLSFAQFSYQQSILNIDVKYRDHFLVDYKYGFNTSEYAYFVVVQKKSHLAEEAGYVTRLSRLCVNDPNYDSYTEVTLQCKVRDDSTGSPTEVNYTILRDAKLSVAGQRLAQQMGIKRDDYVLVAVFSPAKEITNEPQLKSAMCIYSLKDIEETFTENIHMCFNGTIKDRNLGYISGMINDGKCPGVIYKNNVKSILVTKFIWLFFFSIS